MPEYGDAETSGTANTGVYVFPPSTAEADAALGSLDLILKPKRKKGPGYVDPNLDTFTRQRLELMQMFLWAYTDKKLPIYGQPGAWTAASKQVAHNLRRDAWLARKLREWTRAFILDHEDLPVNCYGEWNVSMLEDEELAGEIHLHLQGVGKYVKAMDIVRFLDTPEMLKCLDRKGPITERTAQRWMHTMGYRWTKDPKGQYVDGHERKDVVAYRQKEFLPKFKEIEKRMRDWAANNEEIVNTAQSAGRRIVVWFHDESTFYANDRRLSRWVHADETAKPQPKGEGASLMIADFVSADFGWLRSPDGKESSRWLFKAEKNREGYFTNEEIKKHATMAMDILTKHYPDEEHVLIFDNAPTHLKRPDGALSARKMVKNTPKEGNNWGVEVNVLENGKQVYNSDGKPAKKTIKMGPGTMPDGSLQDFYFPEGHPRAGVFKGMSVILAERGLVEESKLKAQCNDKFQCPPGATNCCCRRTLYCQPDFANVVSVLEIHCRERGFSVIFLPKFHCELNFIEQCWEYAKRVYRHFPVSSKEADLERNVIEALDSVPLVSMRR